MKKTLATLAAALILGASSTTFAVSFSDVPAGHWAYSAVTEMATIGIVGDDFRDGAFHGDNNITNREMATWAANLLQSLSPEFNNAAKELLENYSQKDKPMTRYEIALLLATVYQTAHPGNPPAATEHFTDVPDYHWAKSSVDLVTGAKIMSGFPDGTFRGDDPMKRFGAVLLIDKMYRGLSK